MQIKPSFCFLQLRCLLWCRFMVVVYCIDSPTVYVLSDYVHHNSCLVCDTDKTEWLIAKMPCNIKTLRLVLRAYTCQQQTHLCTVLMPTIFFLMFHWCNKNNVIFAFHVILNYVSTVFVLFQINNQKDAVLDQRNIYILIKIRQP